jgi:hypothetical protein
MKYVVCKIGKRAEFFLNQTAKGQCLFCKAIFTVKRQHIASDSNMSILYSDDHKAIFRTTCPACGGQELEFVFSNVMPEEEHDESCPRQ